MERRGVLKAAAACVAVPRAVQALTRMRRIGVLSLGRAGTEADRIGGQLFDDAMVRLGWKEGSLSYERRFAAGDREQLDTMAAELARSNVELIIATLGPAVAAAQRATRTVPIVMFAATLPVERGFVQTLARPGGNTTGTAVQVVELYAKTFHFIRELSPERRQIAVLGGPVATQDQRLAEAVRQDVTRAGQTIGARVEFFGDVFSERDLAGALERIASNRTDSLYVSGVGVLEARARDIADFAVQHKILASGAYTLFPSFGGAMYYGSNLRDIIERSASFVDRILRGARPGQLPVEFPTRFDLILNRGTLQKLGISPPRHVLLQASEVVG